MFRQKTTSNEPKFVFLRLLATVLTIVATTVTCFSTEDEDENRLFNGRNIEIKEAPFMVQITSEYGIFQCGGTIVSPFHVVTAAHCLHGPYLQKLRVVANATYSSGDGRILREIDGFFQHANYTKKSHDNDVAVLKLKEPLIFGKGIRKVSSLCKKPLLEDDLLKVYGWGVTESGSMSDHLQTVEVKAMTHKNCTKQIKKGITKNMLCAQVEDMKDACKGDSGGPAIHENQLCGIVSWGKNCGGKKPGVYINIIKFKKFINRSKKL